MIWTKTIRRLCVAERKLCNVYNLSLWCLIRTTLLGCWTFAQVENHHLPPRNFEFQSRCPLKGIDLVEKKSDLCLQKKKRISLISSTCVFNLDVGLPLKNVPNLGSIRLLRLLSFFAVDSCCASKATFHAFGSRPCPRTPAPSQSGRYCGSRVAGS